MAALRNPRRHEPAAATRAVVTVLIAYVTLQLLQRALLHLGIATAPRTPLTWLVLLGLTASALAIVGALVTLGLFDARRRRDIVVSVIFGVIAVLLISGQAPPVAAALLGYPAIARTRWRKEVGAGTLGLVILLGIGTTVWNVLTRSLPITALPAPIREIAGLAESSRDLACLYFFFALPGALLRVGVSIRSVTRRLTLSHVLTGVVPLLLVAALWFVSTYLGVGAERATTAARLIDEAGARLEADLSRAAAAARTPGDPARALQTATESYAARWPGLRLWNAGDRLTRVRGDSIPQEARLATWPDTLPGHAVVALGDSVYLGARSDPDSAHGPGPALIALVPIRQVLVGVERTARAPLSIDVRTRLTAGGGAVTMNTDDDRDPLEAPRRGVVRATPPTRTRDRIRLADSLALAAQQDTVAGGRERTRPFHGHSALTGLRAGPRGWQKRNFLLDAEVPVRETLVGLMQNRKENPFNYFVIAIIGVLGAIFLVVAIFNVGMVTAMSRSITRAIGALRSGADQLRSGNLAHRITVEGNDDLWSVAGAFNQMAVGLERSRELEKERERLENELALARQIQARLLPAGPPTIAGLEIAGVSESARQVGGDYYDHLALGDGRVLLVIADVSGKGVPAALIMSGFRAALMSQDPGREDIPTLAARMNHFLCKSVETGRFVTAFIAALDGRTGHIAYTNAGHNPPLIVRHDGTVERLTEGGLLFGFLPDAQFQGGETRLGAGDLAVLFTDGVTEAANSTGEMWEEERLIATVREHSDQSCRAVVAGIVQEVRLFEGDQGASDDVTLLVARRSTT